MSRIGKQPAKIPNSVTVNLKENTLTVKGPKGELSKKFHPNMKIEIKEDMIHISRHTNSKENRALHGLTRSLIVNMIEGVTKGFEKKLEIIGVGYRATPAKNKLTMTLGFSHPIEHIAPAGIEFKMDEENKNVIIVTGIDKELVGENAAKIRSYRKPEPYKGKGIRYIDEQVQRKAGKAAATATAGSAGGAGAQS